ncbi:insecticidal toxin complex protein [Chitinophaga sp. Mgbs1]|uniref:Insecticidal toxin complex protein n=1 Tax=Chitinophaga solisilvae TaxID=1233460 RepID=A0A433WLB9_9BACT|nr:insecticidal toxin complex protein [Chitinophaga solisilvae]
MVIPAINLPKGGGALKGIDEQFSVNAVNGTAAFTIPLPVAPARGAAPGLSLTYNSGEGNGIFGMGWALALPRISRKTDKKIPEYRDATDSDVYLFSGAEDLVPVFRRNADGAFPQEADGRYIYEEYDSADALYSIRLFRPRTEGLFARIERWTAKDATTIRWRMMTKDNTTTLYGWTAAARLTDPADDARIFEWLPEFVFDDKGNCAHYIYKTEDAAGLDMSRAYNKNRLHQGVVTYTNRYLETILYGNKTPYKKLTDTFPATADYFFRNVFDYGEYDTQPPFEKVKAWDFRQDPFSSFKAGFEIRTTRLCKRVLLFHHFPELPGGSALVKSVSFGYNTGNTPYLTLLETTNVAGYIKSDDGSYTSKRLPPVTFTYQQPQWSRTVKNIDASSLVHLPGGLDQNTLFTDLYNEGIAGILTTTQDGWYYKRNLGEGRFTHAMPVTSRPSFAGSADWLLTDLEANGEKQLAAFQATPEGYFPLNDDGNWENFRTFRQLPNINFSDTNMRMLDLNGDGKADLLITEEEVFTWYPSAGKDGFAAACKVRRPADEEQGPAVIFADPQQTIFLADMNGDGLTDIVRVRNGEICYWPNTGYGRFGAKVAMENAPVFDTPEAFNPAWLQLADIDGSGTPDIIYLGKNKFSCWMNACGNSFSAVPFEITPFPAIHPQSRVSITDLLGNGVPCIVWSGSLPGETAASLRYIDLMDGRKPWLMTAYSNGMGKITSLQYTPSTKYYLDDQQQGRPWITRLHFPVHCISGTETRDLISGHRFASAYSYHHGYYDHAEREFRGFGMVTQTDTENFDHWVKGDAANIVPQPLHQEPVITRTWFHTGAFLNGENILGQYAHEYWYEVMKRSGYTVTHQEVTLPDARLITAPGISTTPDVQEWREALRACRGMALRTEVFADDAPAAGATPEQLQQALTPFSVATANCVIELLQPKGQNQHAVFIVRESESITWQYERNIADPRISHQLNLKQDEYGNVLEKAVVAYPRRVADAALPADVQHEQQQHHIIFSQYKYTNDVISTSDYRLRLPAETKSFELKMQPANDLWYTVNDFKDILDITTEVPYHPVAGNPFPQHRLLEHTRSLYYKNNLREALPLYQLESKGIPAESFRLAYTPASVTYIFGDRVNDRLLTEGKFTHSEGDDNWWIPSGTVVYLHAGETETEAQNRFYAPMAYLDPYGARTTVQYYSNYFLLVEAITDAAGNKTNVIRFNFRTLSPQSIKDSNDNITAALTDELGLVKAVAVLGKGDEADDLEGLTESTSAAEIALITQFFQATDSVQLRKLGKQLLGHATTRFVYDLNSFRNNGKPVVVAGIAREAHFRHQEDASVQLSFEYTNGLGQVMMKKVQAEPGMAKQVIIRPDNSYEITIVNTAAVTPVQLRWLGNGRTVLNNKGNPVKQYEPYFSVSHHFEDIRELVETGVTPLICYDAPGRVIRTEMPDGTFSKTVFNSWLQHSYDTGDTVMESDWYRNRIDRRIDAALLAAGKDPEREKSAAAASARYADTPGTQHLDTLGRSILTVAHNRIAGNGDDEYYYTRTHLDITGNLRSITDARNNTVVQYQYDMPGNKVYQHSMDAGRRWLLTNILGNPLRTWDERGHELHYSYDILHRPTTISVSGGDGPRPMNHIISRIIYGEAHPDAVQLNLRGKPLRQYDTAGLTSTPAYDFKGLPLSVTRKLYNKYEETPNWLSDDPDTDLEAESFTFASETDALGRITRQQAPDGSLIVPAYNEGGLLAGETVTHAGAAAASVYIRSVDYNEKRQRSRIVYGNNVITHYYYDRETFRLNRLETRRQNSDPLQDWRYTYDAAGNITHITDSNIPVTFFQNTKITDTATYAYDALYRLLEASGKENNAALLFDIQDNWNDAPFLSRLHPGDPVAMRNYTQRYRYDAVGNIVTMQHQATGNNWTRSYTYDTASNRLRQTVSGNYTYQYPHHEQHGFMTALPHLEDIGWNFKEEVFRTVKQRRTDGGTPETTWYQYDGQGQRIRKITTHAAPAGAIPAIKEERIYVAGFELYKKHTGADAGLRRTTLSLLDQGHRFVMIETRNEVNDGTEQELVRYQLHNHIGSASLELDAAAEVISYEEYHPFGTTAYQAVSAAIKSAYKRYRYTGMERDEETGLEYHSARYYLPWLGRWLSADPIGVADNINVYMYVSGSPMNKKDSTGKYGEAGHYYTVLFISLAAGFDNETSFKNAFYAQMPDEIESLDAIEQQKSKVGMDLMTILNSKSKDKTDAIAERDLVHRGLHTLTGGDTSASRDLTRKALESAKPGSLEFGFLLHRFGDTYAHSRMRNESILYDTGAGHLGDMHDPDLINKRPELYVQYVNDLFSTLSKVSGKPRMSKEEVNELVLRVSKIRFEHLVTRRVGLDGSLHNKEVNNKATEAEQRRMLREGIKELLLRNSSQKSDTPSKLNVDEILSYFPEDEDGLSYDKYKPKYSKFMQGVEMPHINQAAHNTAKSVNEDRPITIR